MTPVGGLSEPDARDRSASVLLPPAQAQRVMILGGGSVTGVAVADVDVIDLKAAVPEFEPASI